MSNVYDYGGPVDYLVDINFPEGTSIYLVLLFDITFPSGSIPSQNVSVTFPKGVTQLGRQIVTPNAFGRGDTAVVVIGQTTLKPNAVFLSLLFSYYASFTFPGDPTVSLPGVNPSVGIVSAKKALTAVALNQIILDAWYQGTFDPGLVWFLTLGAPVFGLNQPVSLAAAVQLRAHLEPAAAKALPKGVLNIIPQAWPLLGSLFSSGAVQMYRDDLLGTGPQYFPVNLPSDPWIWTNPPITGTLLLGQPPPLLQQEAPTS
jgi:hypothetical protein